MNKVFSLTYVKVVCHLQTWPEIKPIELDPKLHRLHYIFYTPISYQQSDIPIRFPVPKLVPRYKHVYPTRSFYLELVQRVSFIHLVTIYILATHVISLGCSTEIGTKSHLPSCYPISMLKHWKSQWSCCKAKTIGLSNIVFSRFTYTTWHRDKHVWSLPKHWTSRLLNRSHGVGPIEHCNIYRKQLKTKKKALIKKKI